jgi:hypothetical protein
LADDDARVLLESVATGPLDERVSEGRVAGPDPDRRDYGSFASFSDPDGNGWVVQEVRTRAPGR